MDATVRRRRLLAALAAAVPTTAGCIGGTPEEIPVHLENDGSRERELSVQFRREEGVEPVFDGTFVLAADDERDEIEQLDHGETYVVTASLADVDGELHEEVSTGGGAVMLTIVIREGGELRTRMAVE